MILRKYGTKVLSVTPNFDSRAMTEIGFMRDGALSMSADDVAERYERLDGRELAATAKGEVQGDVEDAVLADLREQLDKLVASLGDGATLLIENEQGVDQPKTRGRQTAVVVDGENRLIFEYTVDPPLRLSILRPR